MVSPVCNGVFVTVENILQEKLRLYSGVEIFVPSYLDKEKWATTEGVVHSVGANCKLGIKPGDIVALDYRLASDYDINGDSVSYNRVLRVGSEVVWRADEWMILAVWRNNQWHAVGDWCFLEEIEEATVASSLLILTELSKQKKQGHGIIVSGSDAPVGTTAVFPEKYRSLYTFPNGKTYIVLNKDYILGYAPQG